MILVDANVPMYIVGGPHPHKVDAQRLLERCILADERLVTDAEAMQEILHRYVAIGRPDAIQPAFSALLDVVDQVLPVTKEDVLLAKELVLGLTGTSARDAIHVAIMRGHGIDRILTFDRAFDRVPGISRVR